MPTNGCGTGKYSRKNEVVKSTQSSQRISDLRTQFRPTCLSFGGGHSEVALELLHPVNCAHGFEDTSAR